MRIFLDTANPEEIRKAMELGVISGVTTNPSLIAKEKGKDFVALVREITALVPGPINVEVMAEKSSGMIGEAIDLAALGENIVIKIPMTSEGLKAVNVLQPMGVKTNVTLVFSVNQALLAARAGAAYVSPFVGRLDDIGHDGIALVEDIVKIFDKHNLSTEVIAASIRHPLHVVKSALAGAHIATVPYKVLLLMYEHPLTAAGIEKFRQDWS